MSQLEECMAALERNRFRCFMAENTVEAGEIIKRIMEEFAAATVSYGDSETLKSTGILDYCRVTDRFSFIDTFNKEETWKQQVQRRKESLTADLFMTGTNAVTLGGKLVNLDMVGNRIGGLIFGPKKVIVTVGKNKVVTDLDSAFRRVREVAAPMNAARHPEMKNPCTNTGKCMDCSSPTRICNTWSITEKSFPEERITVILIDEELGL